MSSLPRVLVVLNTKLNVLEKYFKGSDKETLRIKTPTMHTLQTRMYNSNSATRRPKTEQDNQPCF